MKKLTVFLLLLLCSCGTFRSSGDHASQVKTELTSELDYLRHEYDNYQVELRLLEGKINSQESVIGLLHDQVLEFQQANKKFVGGQIGGFEENIAALEARQEAIVSDVRKLKTHANDMSASFSQYRGKMKEFEGILDKQNKNIRHLESAFNSLLAAVEQTQKGASIAARPGFFHYRVKSGDTLEKIARTHKTSVEELKRNNKLKSDLIVVGQDLLIPEIK